MKTLHAMKHTMVAGLTALALGAALPDLRAQQLSSSARIELSAMSRGTEYPVHFAFKFLDNGKETKGEGKNEEELRADFRKWLGEYAACPVQDALGLDAMGLDAIAAYLARIGNDPKYQPRGVKGWIRQEWINAEFEAYNRRWAPVVYALDSRTDLDRTYRTQLTAFLADDILKKRTLNGVHADTTRLVPLLNGLPLTSTYSIAPSIAVKMVNVGYGLEAGDNLEDYVQTLYPSTATNPYRRVAYGTILATLNPHAMQRTIGPHYLLKTGMTVVVPAEAFLESELRRSAQDGYASLAANPGMPAPAPRLLATSSSP